MYQKGFLSTIVFLLFLTSNIIAITGSVTKTDLLLVSLQNKNYTQAVEIIKDEPNIIYTTSSGGLTPLMLAIKNNDMEMFDFLIKQGAPIESPYYEKPLLIYALYQDSLETFQSILQLSASPNVTYNSLDILHIAILLDKTSFIKALLNKKIDVDLTDPKGLTPISLTAYKELFALASLIAPYSQNLNPVDKNNLTPILYYITRSPTKLPLWLKALEPYPKEILDFQTKTVPSAIHMAINKNDIHTVKLLLDSGASVNLQDPKTKDTPLILAIKQNNLELIKLLLLYNPNIALKNSQKKMAQSVTDNKEILDLLEEYKKAKN